MIELALVLTTLIVSAGYYLTLRMVMKHIQGIEVVKKSDRPADVQFFKEAFEPTPKTTTPASVPSAQEPKWVEVESGAQILDIMKNGTKE